MYMGAILRLNRFFWRDFSDYERNLLKHPVYNNVGAVKRKMKTLFPRRGKGCQGRPQGRLSRPCHHAVFLSCIHFARSYNGNSDRTHPLRSLGHLRCDYETVFLASLLPVS